MNIQLLAILLSADLNKHWGKSKVKFAARHLFICREAILVRILKVKKRMLSWFKIAVLDIKRLRLKLNTDKQAIDQNL